ncbi:hypothetical protein CsSME_00035843 [Camellia sinensis var. sinensis]
MSSALIRRLGIGRSRLRSRDFKNMSIFATIDKEEENSPSLFPLEIQHEQNKVGCLKAEKEVRRGLWPHFPILKDRDNPAIGEITYVTNIEYEEHKGRIAIGRLHAGVLRRGLDVQFLSGLLPRYVAGLCKVGCARWSNGL